MELRATREMRRNEQLNRATGKKAESAPAAKAAPRRESADKCSLSRQALAYLEQQTRLEEELAERRNSQQSRIQGYLDAMKTKKDQLDAMGEKLDVMNKCQKIAAAVMRGDRVPPEDLRYLMEHDKEGYKMAMALRRPKKDPKDMESVLDDEDKTGETSQASGGEEAPSAEGAGGLEAAGGVEGGGAGTLE